MKDKKINKFKAFTLTEMMMALVVLSIILAALAPVMTASVAKPKNENIQVQRVIDSTPVGVIVAWIGNNYPEGWIPLDGRSITDYEYQELRKVLGGIDTLPNMNEGTDPNAGTNWIIKAANKN